MPPPSAPIGELPPIGQPFTAFSAQRPEVVNHQTDPNRQYSVPTTLLGLPGRWIYTFRDGSLQRFEFDSYSDLMESNNFDRYLVAAQTLIGHFQSHHGTPQTLEFPNRAFRNPFTEAHDGYEVIDAIWRTAAMDFRVRFLIMGLQGEFQFVFSMHFHPAGYPYF